MRICQILDKNISYKVYTGLSTIHAHWDEFLPDGHFLKSTRLSVMQQSNLEDVSFVYMEVFRNGNCIGLLYCQLFRFHSGHYSAELLDQTSIQLVRNFILRQETGLLICGNLFHLQEPGFYFKEGEDESLLFQILHHFQRRCSVKVSGILVKDSGSQLNLAEAKETNFQPFERDVLMEIPIRSDWQNLDYYVDSLSKKYRQRASKILTAKETLEVRFLSLNEIQEFSTDIERLYQNVRSKQTFRLGALNAQYFYLMKKALGENFMVKAWFLDRKMIAFSSLFTHPGNKLEIHYIGFEYEMNEKFALYFNIIFDGIQEAIKNNAVCLMLGRTGYDAKASAGAVPVSGNHFYKIKRGIPALAFRYFSSSYRSKESEGWRKRNPFKMSIPENEPVTT